MSLAKSRMPARGPGRPLSLAAWSMAMSLYCTNAAADPTGRLIFLGWTADQQHSVWLSAISPGQFEVESAKQNQIYDSWQQDRRGLHLTLSPEVQSGGTHKLYAYGDGSGKRVLLDTDNQQPGHFTFPDHFTPPSGPILPPQGMMPTRPGTLLPNRPGGVQPPIGTVPPQGAMPTRPGGVQPPIGTVPPQGVMPTRPGSLLPNRPGGAQPPIGTVPPQGVMPTRPGGVQPPTGTVPPQGVMPTRPGGLLPPAGAIPPQGMMPTRPDGLLPTRPGGTQPPIGTVPPQGVMPTRPGGLLPPAGTIPPQGMMPTRPDGLLPTRPGGVQPPIGTVPPQGGMPTRPPLGERPVITLPSRVEPAAALPGRVTAGQQASERALNERTLCVMPDERDRLPVEQRDHYPDCPFSRAELAAGQVSAREQLAPVQPAERRWSLWADEVYYDISDHRYGLDISGSTNVFSLGADTRLDNRLILGFSVSRVDSRVDAFNGGMHLSAGGYNIGPYLAYPLSESWMLDAGWQPGLRLDGQFPGSALPLRRLWVDLPWWQPGSHRPVLLVRDVGAPATGHQLQP